MSRARRAGAAAGGGGCAASSRSSPDRRFPNLASSRALEPRCGRRVGDRETPAPRIEGLLPACRRDPQNGGLRRQLAERVAPPSRAPRHRREAHRQALSRRRRRTRAPSRRVDCAGTAAAPTPACRPDVPPARGGCPRRRSVATTRTASRAAGTRTSSSQSFATFENESASERVASVSPERPAGEPSSNEAVRSGRARDIGLRGLGAPQ